MDIKSKKITVLGAGRSGVSAAKLANFLGAKVLISDIKSDIHNIDLKNVEIESGAHSDRVLESDLIIKSPGIPNTIDIIKRAKLNKINVISEIEFAGLFSDLPIIGVTGSNGKTTTVELLNNIFHNAGYNPMLGGNVGTPFSDNVLNEINENIKEGIHILELSSFQLEGTNKISLDIGCILNLSEDHLDRYIDYEDYISAKLKIVNLIRSNGHLIYNSEDKILKERIDDSSSVGFDPSQLSNIIKDKDSIPLKGKHNYSNIAAALAISSKYSIDNNTVLRSIKEFMPLDHRLELINRINGISIYNDSKATNLKSMMAAIESFNDEVVIVGGLDKGNSDFLSAIKIHGNKIKFISCYGESGQTIYNNLKSEFECIYNKEFNKAVIEAFSRCICGDTLLLSPGCASYDQFDSYIERGNKFKEIIIGLS